MAYTEPMDFFAKRRASLEYLSTELISIAEKVESISSESQLTTMRKVTFISTLVVTAYRCDLLLFLLTFVVFSLKYEALPAAMPFLPDVRSIHVGMLCLQTVFVVVGPLGYLSIATYHEGCMYLSTLFKTLASHIVISTSRKSLNVLIGIHQELHTFGNKFSATFSRSWSFIHFMVGFFVTYTTYLILVGFVEPLYYVSACTVALALFVPRFLSEPVAIVCESVCQSAYSCDWINNDLSFKRDVALVILRSQKTLYLSEGVFGKLSLKKYLAIINDWYRMVQFFFNVG